MTRGGKRIGSGRPQTNHPKKHLIRLTDIEKDFIDFSRVKQIDLNKLKKGLLLFFLMLFTCMPVSATTLKGSVEYTVDIARSEAFNDLPNKLPRKELNKYKYDRFNYTHLYLISINSDNHKELGIIKIVPFYKDLELVCYGIQYTDKPNYKFYYTPNGILIKYEIMTNTTYPYKSVVYSPYNNLISVNLIISPKESFIFNKDKSLYAHWLNDLSYDKDNNLINVVRRL